MPLQPFRRGNLQLKSGNKRSYGDDNRVLYGEFHNLQQVCFQQPAKPYCHGVVQKDFEKMSLAMPSRACALII